jgi:hypothetical protein
LILAKKWCPFATKNADMCEHLGFINTEELPEIWSSWIEVQRERERERERESYQSGPAGGGISNPVNPLMH